jgi:hypothetical protein
MHPICFENVKSIFFYILCFDFGCLRLRRERLILPCLFLVPPLLAPLAPLGLDAALAPLGLDAALAPLGLDAALAPLGLDAAALAVILIFLHAKTTTMSCLGSMAPSLIPSRNNVDSNTSPFAWTNLDVALRC